MNTMKKTVLATAIGLAFGLASAGASASTLTFADNTTPAAAPLPFTIGAGGFTTGYTAAFAAGKEFRMISPANNAPGGGGEKSIYNGGEQWIFNGDSITGGTMTGVANTPSNPGATGFAGSAAPTAGTNPTLGQPAPFFGSPFNFLAPTTTSLAGTAYEPATLSFDSTDAFTVHFNVMEAQWGGTWFPMGQDGGVGITFNCTGAHSGNFTCFAQHKITLLEDPGSAGFATWVAQWDITGTLSPTHPVPIPAAVWLFGSGLLGLVGIARRKRNA